MINRAHPLASEYKRSLGDITIDDRGTPGASEVLDASAHLIAESLGNPMKSRQRAARQVIESPGAGCGV